ncbi:uncharacterized protein LOC107004425 [Solanum pennellii]|uniref:Uncharacterized protein LOC107004425 n=1 Tax=Solanum pennellii TaxID=28526 RepID=A0ABM1UYP3_SOLPN|nr:uncharacterized protein LOC107004425 [Solanum pennellii]
MATEESKEWHVVKNWRNAQKEKERERRRIRDRLRRQTMSNEEREKHLARRRRNYQLRRQKVLNNSSSSICQNCDSTTSAGIRVMKFTLLLIRYFKILGSSLVVAGYSNEDENQATVPVSELGVQLSDVTFHPELYKSQEDASSTLHKGVEERSYKVQRIQNTMPLYQIRHLARLLNSFSSNNQEIGTKDNVNTESKFLTQTFFMSFFFFFDSLSFYRAEF